MHQYGITCNAFSPFARTRAAYELTAYDMAVSEEESPWMDSKFSFPLDMTPSPDHVAPFVIYLATEAGAKISASVFNFGGNNIGLYSESEIARSLTKFGAQWTLEELMQQAP